MFVILYEKYYIIEKGDEKNLRKRIFGYIIFFILQPHLAVRSISNWSTYIIGAWRFSGLHSIFVTLKIWICKFSYFCSWILRSHAFLSKNFIWVLHFEAYRYKIYVIWVFRICNMYDHTWICYYLIPCRLWIGSGCFLIYEENYVVGLNNWSFW